MHRLQTYSGLTVSLLFYGSRRKSRSSKIACFPKRTSVLDNQPQLVSKLGPIESSGISGQVPLRKPEV